MMRIVVTLLALLGLAACGELPRPFAGNLGGEAQHLAEPPPVRLIVPVPRNIFLPEGPSADLARVLAENLLDVEVPAAIGVPKRGDWRLVIEADHRGSDVVPTYRVIDPAGEQRGITEGLPVPTELWVNNPPLRRISGEATPRVVSLLNRIEAARRQSDPNSLQNRAPRLLVTEVTGAPGDGNVTLARLVKVELVKAGQELQDEAKGADFTLTAQVSVVPAGAGKQRVEIQWIINDAKGSEAGRVVQLNEIPAGMLDRYWGDVALVVAKEAAGGVRDVIANRVAAKYRIASPDLMTLRGLCRPTLLEGARHPAPLVE